MPRSPASTRERTTQLRSTSPWLFLIVLFPFWVIDTRQTNSNFITYQLWGLRQVTSFYASVSPSVHEAIKALTPRVGVRVGKVHPKYSILCSVCSVSPAIISSCHNNQCAFGREPCLFEGIMMKIVYSLVLT